MLENFIDINNKKLCAHCFRNTTNMEFCPNCCNKQNAADSLPAGTILHGKYIVGRALYYDNHYYGYYGYSPASDERVFIREFFPAGVFCKRSGKQLVCDLQDSAMAMEFNTVVNNFHTEVKLMSGFKDTDSILKVYDLFDENGTTYSIVQFPENAVLLSEYIDGHNGKLSADEAFRIMESILSTLDILHKNGTIHGNIRPENIVLFNKKVFLTGMNYGGQAFLDNTSSPLYTNLNRFAAIEYFSKSDKRGPWTDIFALGTTVYYMLTGKLTKNVFERIENLENTSVPSAFARAPEIPAKLYPVLTRMVEVKIADRYQNIYELSKALNSTHLVKTKIKPPKKQKSSGGKGKLIAVIAAILILLAGGAAVFFTLYPFEGKDNSDETLPAESTVTEQTGETDESTEDTLSDESDTETLEESDTATTEESDTEAPEKPETETTEESREDESVSEDESADTGIGTLIGDNWVNNRMFIAEGTVFCSKQYRKEQITTATFLSTLENVPENAWDISSEQDGGVMVWIEEDEGGYNLFIASDGGINGEDSCRNLFADYTNLTSVSFNGCFNTQNVTDMSGMFKHCNSLQSLDLTDFNTQNVTDMSGMFEGCLQLTGIDLKGFDTRMVENMSRMFYMCCALKSLDLDHFNTSRVTDLTEMFYSCASLTELKIRNFGITKATDIDDMFTGCVVLTSINSDNMYITAAFNDWLASFTGPTGDEQ